MHWMKVVWNGHYGDLSRFEVKMLQIHVGNEVMERQKGNYEIKKLPRNDN